MNDKFHYRVVSTRRVCLLSPLRRLAQRQVLIACAAGFQLQVFAGYASGVVAMRGDA